MSKTRATLSLADFEVADLIYRCRLARSTTPLIAYLRTDKPITAQLRAFLTAILAGEERLTARPIPRLKRFRPEELRVLRDGMQSALMGEPTEVGLLWEGDDGWSRLVLRAREAGFDEPEGDLQNRQVARRCAEMILAHDLRCTMNQLDVALRPRARGRRVIHPVPGKVSGKK